MRIIIDMQGAQSASRFRGIGRYSMSLSLAIARNAGEHEIWLVLNAAFQESILSIRHAFNDFIPQKRIRVFEVPSSIYELCSDNSKRARAAELIRESFIEQLKPDVVLITSLFEGYADDAVVSVGLLTSKKNTAIILYDLIPYLYPDTYLPESIQRNYYYRKIESLKKAGLLLSISESARKEGIEALGLLESEVRNISTAVDDVFCPIQLSNEQIENLRQLYGLKRKLVMYAPSGFDIRKNIHALVEAYSQLPGSLRKEYQLVIVGNGVGDYPKKINQIAKKVGLAEDELVFTGHVTDEELIILYNLAILFVFPSKHEGFGLPVLEAMSCGTAVIGSNTTSIPEVIGAEDALFDPESSESIANKMKQALENVEFRKKLQKQAMQQAKIFSWDKTAKWALDALSDLYVNNLSNVTVKNENVISKISKLYTTTESIERDLVLIASSLATNNLNGNSRKLLLDISVIVNGDDKSGIQRVVRSILTEMLKNPPDGYDVQTIYFDGEFYRYAADFMASFFPKIKSPVVEGSVNFQQDDIYLALDLNMNITGIVHDFHKYLQCLGVELYFIVYDILLIQRPDWWPEGASLIFEEWLKNISEVSTGLICISESVANDVRAWMDTNPPKRLSSPYIKSFHLGADIKNSLPSKGEHENAEFVIEQLASTTSFLMVGTLEPRKGYEQTLEAFESLWEEGADVGLVVVGREGWLVGELVKKIRSHSELHKRLFWLEGISDEYLEKVYEASTCLILASEGEGFGLPLIEAAQHKMPIIARNLPVFKEVAGRNAFYFENKRSSRIISSTVLEWLELYRLGDYPKSDEMPWLTWRESTRQLLKILIVEEFLNEEFVSFQINKK